MIMNFEGKNLTHYLFYVCLVFETGSLSVSHASIDFVILLPHSQRAGFVRYEPPYLASMTSL